MKKTRARRGWIGMKIDFMKAFDRLEWSFIVKILENLGFHSTFISWIYQCISTFTFSILLNGSLHGHFSPSRGKPGDLGETIKRIKTYFVEHNKRGRNSEMQEGSPSITALQLESTQEPTGPDWTIISTDASWNSCRSCLSGVLQHPNSPPILSWFQISQEDKPLQAEAHAALLALTIAADRGSSKIWLRCDALLLVDAILYPHNSPWEIRSLVSDITFTLSRFPVWICSWIPRLDNSLAHDLGHFGAKSNFTSLCIFQGYPNLKSDVDSSNLS
ncbi:hypothetical protein CRG98_043604 [Punica granatum]|uniref:RNase H type-1 domain-containing protein n=1 Tax=Punica granatum TaxID=22663 RepID=A0A2I0HWE2_PUNGR|nr:hypothetical protein CRG98_043604 [Punica granatum]